ncbi:chemotaxis protein CheW [Novosphingobium profundi]|nr:chemotaxis protein CheW [Novosphingobium profundi]
MASTGVSKPSATPEPGLETAFSPDVQPGLYGIVRAGELFAAFAIGNIREVVPFPGHLIAWPRTRPELLGAFSLRGAVIPVLDLRSLLQVGADGLEADDDNEEECVVLVLQHQDDTFSVRITEICGVADLGEDALTALRRDGTGKAHVAPAAFVHKDSSGLVVDVAALAGLSGLPRARSRVQALTSQRERGTPRLLASVGGHLFAFAAASIDATMPHSNLSPCPIADPLWIGMLAYNGRKVPVIDTLGLFGLGEVVRTAQAACLVLRMADGELVALQIDSAQDMLSMSDTDIRPLEVAELECLRFFQGIYEFGDKLALVVEPKSLQECPELAQLACLEEAGIEQAGAGSMAGSTNLGEHGGAECRARPFLLVRLGGGRFAVPLEHVVEILPVSTSRIACPGARAGQSLIVHRGKTIALHSLGRALGQERDDAGPGPVIVVRLTDSQIGFEVDALVSVERVPLQTLNAKEGAPSMGLLTHTLALRDGTCSVLDIARII